MDSYIKAFIRASLLWFLAGIALGLAMAVHPAWIVYRPAHAHMMVAGFVTMLIFGVGYQLLPRLFGHALESRALAVAHLYLANVGLAGLVAGFLVQPHDYAASVWLMGTGGGLFALGALFWIWNLWRTFDAAERRQQQQRAGKSQKSLPTLGE